LLGAGKAISLKIGNSTEIQLNFLAFGSNYTTLISKGSNSTPSCLKPVVIHLHFPLLNGLKPNTAMEKRKPKSRWNIRDQASPEQLVLLSNLESINAVLIHQVVAPNERLLQLNKIAITQMKLLLNNSQLKKLK